MASAAEAERDILIVDDDADIREALGGFLARHGFAPRVAANAVEMDAAIDTRRPELVVLDVMMPGENGLSICRRLSGDGVPIIMLSAMGEDTDRIVGLEIGADDYLAKPFNPRELLARIRAVLRRREPAQGKLEPAYVFAGWRLALSDLSLLDPTGSVVTLSSGEINLLRAFVENPHRILSRDQLLELSRGPMAETYDRAIDLQVSRLRRKLDDGSGAEMIQTIRGEGYRFAPRVRRG